MYPTDEETFNERVSPEFIKDDHLNDIQAFLKRLQDFLGYGGRLHDKFGLVLPTGSWVGFGGLTAPDGWLLCDGKAYDYTHSDYADLYAVIGGKYGTPWVDYFNVPDFRGYFFRGYSKIPSVNFVPADVNVGQNRITLSGQTFHRTCFPVRFTTADTLPAPLAINTTYFLYIHPADDVYICASRPDSLTATFIVLTTQGVGTHTIHPYIEEDKDTRVRLTCNSGSQEDLGSYQEDEFKTHRHETFNDANKVNAGVNFRSIRHITGNDDSPTSYVGGVETRPRNVNVNYIIKR